MFNLASHECVKTNYITPYTCTKTIVIFQSQVLDDNTYQYIKHNNMVIICFLYTE